MQILARCGSANASFTIHDSRTTTASPARLADVGQDIYEPLLICGIDGKDVYQHNHFCLTEMKDVPR
jgi:hypothetical protein